MKRPIRVLVAKVGLDGHDRGAKVIASALRDAGMEVIYTGLRQTPEMVVNAALQEDVDAIGISILSGAHMTVFPKVIELMKLKGMDDVLLTGGGIIPEEDSSALEKIGCVGPAFIHFEHRLAGYVCLPHDRAGPARRNQLKAEFVKFAAYLCRLRFVPVIHADENGAAIGQWRAGA